MAEILVPPSIRIEKKLGALGALGGSLLFALAPLLLSKAKVLVIYTAAIGIWLQLKQLTAKCTGWLAATDTKKQGTSPLCLFLFVVVQFS